MKKISDLPKSEDKEFWEDAESMVSHLPPVAVCATHGKENWKDHIGYIDNKDGTASCEKCSWGFRIPGYLRVHNRRVYDLRDR